VKHILSISPLHPQASSILPKRVHCHHLICLDSRVYSHCSARLTRVTPRPPRRPRRAPRPQPRPPRDPAHPHSGIGRLHAHSHIAQSKHEMQRPWRMGRAPRQPSRHATRRGAATCRCAVHVPGAAACARSRAHPHGMARGTRHCDSRLRCPFFVAASTRRRCGDRTQWPAAHRKVSNRADRIEVVDRTIGGVRSRPSSLHITEVRDRLHGKK
jgi:hypothetical protein